MTGATTSPSFPAGGSTVGLASAGPSTQNPTQLANTTIKQFIAQKRPENLYQRVACLAYYLTHVSGTPHFKTADISKANTDAAAPKFSNAAAFVNKSTARYNYLSAAGKGNKQITAFGEQVVEALPDREKVKQLHGEYKPRGRGKAKKKPK